MGGYGRSGSTLLGYLLGRVEGAVVVGEMAAGLAAAMATPGELCGCGVEMRSCPFWQEVCSAALGSGWEARMASFRMARTAMYQALHRYPRTRRASIEAKIGLVGSLGALYDAVRAVSGAETVVDTSKLWTDAIWANAAVDGAARIVHLHRDPRGVAYSWQKHVRRPEVVSGDGLMSRYTVWHSATRWCYQNLRFEQLRRAGLEVGRLRYEDLARHPSESVSRVMPHATWSSSHMIEDPFGRKPQHTIRGNPAKFGGPAPIRLDESWKKNLSARHRLVVEAVCWPLMLRYGYPVL